MPSSVTVAICCYNSAQRLPQTLRHLQNIQTTVPWEVLVVDNASTDSTAEVARQCWSDSAVPLRVVREAKPGLSQARACAVANSESEIISFIDDDNWVAPNWVDVVWEVMSANPQVGACGGLVEAACEVEPPEWFARYQRDYAVGRQGHAEGDSTDFPGFIWGAGLNIRRAAWDSLMQHGFRSFLGDRRGAQLSSGGDSELCLALRVAGWRLYYCPRLMLKHFIPASRLQWSYLRRLYRGFGAASVGIDPYYFVIKQTYLEKPKRTWLNEVWVALHYMLEQRRQSLLAFAFSDLEGDASALTIERCVGRLRQLFQIRGAYDRSFDEIRNAAWRTI